MLATVSINHHQPQGLQGTAHTNNTNPEHSDNEISVHEEDTSRPESSELTKKLQFGINNEEQLKVLQLKRRDLEVKTHEQAHLSAAGSFATGGASFSYTTGPNGQRYATGGEVGIDLSPIAGDPAATIKKAETIRRAALAPASPSAQDRSVASKASAMLHKAINDLAEETENVLTISEKKQPEQEKSGSNKAIANESASTAGTLIDFTV